MFSGNSTAPSDGSRYSDEAGRNSPVFGDQSIPRCIQDIKLADLGHHPPSFGEIAFGVNFCGQQRIAASLAEPNDRL